MPQLRHDLINYQCLNSASLNRNIFKLITIWVRRRHIYTYLGKLKCNTRFAYLRKSTFRFTDNVQRNLSRLLWDLPSVFFTYIVIYSIYYLIYIYCCCNLCPIITHQPINQFATNFDWETRQNGNVVCLV